MNSVPNIFSLSQESKLLIDYFLKNIEVNSSITSTPTSSAPKLIIPLYRFCLGTLNNSRQAIPLPPIRKRDDYESLCRMMRIYIFKNLIIDTIEKNQVTFIISHSGYGKTSQVPLYIIDWAESKRLHCQIISVQSCKIVANYCYRKCLEQRDSSNSRTICYQAELESFGGNLSNLLFTTTRFFLRCLISKNGRSMRSILNSTTHIIIDDFHQRDIYTGILLTELKDAMKYYPHLKLIILSNPISNVNELEIYFGKTSIIDLTYKNVFENISISYVDDFCTSTESSDDNLSAIDQSAIDIRLFNYVTDGNNDDFQVIMELIRMGNLSVNVQHSINKFTMLMGAARFGNFDHINQLLIYNDINVMAQDIYGATAYNYANVRTREYLLKLYQVQSICVPQYSNALQQPPKINHIFLCNIIKKIHDDNICNMNRILIFLPTYEDMLRQKFLIRQILTNVEVHILTEETERLEILSIESTFDVQRKIILSSDIAESSINIKNVCAVIDSGIMCDNENEEGSYDEDDLQLRWITHEKAERRALIASRSAAYLNDGTIVRCIRLFYKHEFIQMKFELQEKLERKISASVLEKVCLYLKCMHTSSSNIANYIQKMLPEHHSNVPDIEKCLMSLKLIGALNDDGDITLLGIRLLDIQTDIRFGKTLIYSLLLQCSDPVLTIVSMLLNGIYKIFFKTLHDVEGNGATSVNFDGIKYLKFHFDENQHSDHLVLLRVFQQWENEVSGNRNGTFPTNNRLYDLNNEEKFVLNGFLERACKTRRNLVGVLRSIGLIQSNGYRNISYANVKSDNWCLVKSCFVAGLYPNLCFVKQIANSYEIRSQYNEITFIDRNSTLEGLNHNMGSYQSSWIICQNFKTINGYKIAQCNTMVSPFTIALFYQRCNLLNRNLTKTSKLILERYGDFGLENNDEIQIKILQEILHENLMNIIETNERDANRCALSITFRQIFSNNMGRQQQTTFSNNRKCISRKYFVIDNPLIDYITNILKIEDYRYKFNELQRKINGCPKILGEIFSSNLDRVNEEFKYEKNLPKTVSQSLNTTSWMEKFTTDLSSALSSSLLPSNSSFASKLEILRDNFNTIRCKLQITSENTKYFVLHVKSNNFFGKSSAIEFVKPENPLWNYNLISFNNNDDLSQSMNLFVFFFNTLKSNFYGQGQLMMFNKKWYLFSLLCKKIKFQDIQNKLDCSKINYQKLKTDGFEIDFNTGSELSTMFDTPINSRRIRSFGF